MNARQEEVHEPNATGSGHASTHGQNNRVQEMSNQPDLIEDVKALRKRRELGLPFSRGDIDMLFEMIQRQHINLAIASAYVDRDQPADMSAAQDRDMLMSEIRMLTEHCTCIGAYAVVPGRHHSINCKRRLG